MSDMTEKDGNENSHVRQKNMLADRSMKSDGLKDPAVEVVKQHVACEDLMVDPQLFSIPH